MSEEKYKETLNFLFSSADERDESEDEENPHAKDTTYCPEVVEALQEQFGEAVREVDLYANEHTVLLDKEVIVEAARFLKEQEEFNFLPDLGGVDRFTDEERYEVFYNMVSIPRNKRLRLKVRVDEDDMTVPSLTSVYRSANWNERECYDMFGITFEDHPDMRRMYMPEDFEYHPLRKEFPPLGIPGSLPLPAGEKDGEMREDPFPSAHGDPPRKEQDRR